MDQDYSTMRFPASINSLPAVTAFVEGKAAAAGVMPAKLPGLCLAVEEAFVNICTYAFSGHEGQVEFICFSTPDAFVLEIMDSGPEFDMLSVPRPDTSVEMEQREAGGLGVYFIRHFTDHSDWRRENNKNILRLTMDLDDGTSHPKET